MSYDWSKLCQGFVSVFSKKRQWTVKYIRLGELHVSHRFHAIAQRKIAHRIIHLQNYNHYNHPSCLSVSQLRSILPSMTDIQVYVADGAYTVQDGNGRAVALASVFPSTFRVEVKLYI